MTTYIFRTYRVQNLYISFWTNFRADKMHFSVNLKFYTHTLRSSIFSNNIFRIYAVQRKATGNICVREKNYLNVSFFPEMFEQTKNETYWKCIKVCSPDAIEIKYTELKKHKSNIVNLIEKIATVFLLVSMAFIFNTWPDDLPLNVYSLHFIRVFFSTACLLFTAKPNSSWCNFWNNT